MKASLSALLALSLLCGVCSAFKFVYVPCDSNRPMEEWSLVPSKDDDQIGCLTDHLQKWYSRSGKMTQDQEKAFKAMLNQRLTEKHGEKEAENLVNNERAANMLNAEAVEIVTLLPPLSENGYVSVTMYVDDKGCARQLPMNQRASGIMQATTARAGPVLGDAFFGRCYDNENDEFVRMDLCLNDLSSGAGWFKLSQEHKKEADSNKERVDGMMRAMKANKELPDPNPTKTLIHEQDREEINQAFKDEEDPVKRDGFAPFPAAQKPPLATERECLDSAEELRVLGNGHFANGDYALALRKYGKALRYLRHRWHMSVPPGCRLGDGGIEEEAANKSTSCELNSAFCHLKLGDYNRAIGACDRVLDVDPCNAKALYRKGCAQRDHGGDMEVAKRTLKSALDLVPGDKSVRLALQMCAAIDSKSRASTASFSKNIFGGQGKGIGGLYPEVEKKPETAADDNKKRPRTAEEEEEELEIDEDYLKQYNVTKEELDKIKADADRACEMPSDEMMDELEKGEGADGKASGDAKEGVGGEKEGFGKGWGEKIGDSQGYGPGGDEGRIRSVDELKEEIEKKIEEGEFEGPEPPPDQGEGDEDMQEVDDDQGDRRPPVVIDESML